MVIFVVGAVYRIVSRFPTDKNSFKGSFSMKKKDIRGGVDSILKCRHGCLQ